MTSTDVTLSDEAAAVRPLPTHAELERAITSVPGVEEAHVTLIPETGKSRLRIRLSGGHDTDDVSWAIATTLRERFGIAVDPQAIRPRIAAPDDAGADEGADAGEPIDPDGADDTGVVVVGDRVMLSEAARAVLAEAVGAAHDESSTHEADDLDGAAAPGDRPTAEAPPVDEVLTALEEVQGEPAQDAERSDTAAASPSVEAWPEEIEEAWPEESEEASPEESEGAWPEESEEASPEESEGAWPEEIEEASPEESEGAWPQESEGAWPEESEEASPEEIEEAWPEEVDEVAEEASPDEVATAREHVHGTATGDVPEDASEGPSEHLRLITSDQAVPARRDPGRAAIRHLDTHIDVSDVRVTATLSHRGRTVTGEARSVATSQGILRAVAEATVHALRALTGDRLVVSVDAVLVSVTGQPPNATVMVGVVTDRGEETLLGCSLVRNDPERAVMRATLDALNRRVEPWLEVDLAG